MALKSSEKELKRKEKYYKDNKEKILEKKHSRQSEIYANKVARAMSNDAEWEKDFTRKMSKLEHIKPDACELCGVKELDLGYYLEEHHFDYQKSDETAFLCKPCHAEADKMRRRQ
jgi:hypothetical protein